MKFVIVHGFNSGGKELVDQGRRLQNERDWIPWLKEKIEEKGHEAYNPLMPNFWNPSYEEWKEKFEEFNIDENTVLIGHSLGGGFLLKYLSENKISIKKLILVAPSVIAPEEFLSIKSFYEYRLDNNLPNRTNGITIFSCDSDLERIREGIDFLEDSLEFKHIKLKDRGHFIRKDMGTVEFPELLEEVLS